jgi:taurine dioxygenase
MRQTAFGRVSAKEFERTTVREYAQIEVAPVTPVIGAEIGGVDLSGPLDEATFDEVHAALMDHLVIFLRDQRVTPEQHKDFGRRFGELHIHPAAPAPEGHPEILLIHADENSRHVAGHGWHSDVSCDEAPPMGSILYLTQVPDSGGDTMFASMYAAYEALSDKMQAFLSSLTAMHESEHVYRGRYGLEERLRDGNYPSAEHPVVRTHPVTGRKGLFVNSGFTRRIVGMKPAESRNLLDFLFDHIRAPEFHCRFRWQANSIAFWDNRCTQHHALWDYWPEVRHGHRVTIDGDRPYH